VGRASHMRNVFRMGADAAENTEHRLHEERRLHQPAVEEMFQAVEMSDVVAFELEACAVRAAGGEDIFDILEGIAEDEIAGILQMFALPSKLEIPVAVEQMKQPEIH